MAERNNNSDFMEERLQGSDLIYVFPQAIESMLVIDPKKVFIPDGAIVRLKSAFMSPEAVVNMSKSIASGDERYYEGALRYISLHLAHFFKMDFEHEGRGPTLDGCFPSIPLDEFFGGSFWKASSKFITDAQIKETAGRFLFEQELFKRRMLKGNSVDILTVYPASSL